MKQTKLRQKLRLAAERSAIDEYGELHLKTLAPYKSAFARATQLAASIRARFADHEPRLPVTAEGDYYSVTLSPCGMQTRIEDMQAVYDVLGHDAFLAACSMTLAKLAKELSPGRFEGLLIKEQTGSRTLTVIEMAE